MAYATLARRAGSGLPVGGLLAVALIGGTLLFVGVGMVLACQVQKRQKREATTRAIYGIPITEPGAGSTTTRLTKRRLLASESAVGGAGLSSRLSSKFSLSSLPPMLPPLPLPTYHSLNIFGHYRVGGDGSKKKKKGRARSRSWVESDNFHGPGLNRHVREGWFTRDSWLGRVPTFPNLNGGGGHGREKRETELELGQSKEAEGGDAMMSGAVQPLARVYGYPGGGTGYGKTSPRRSPQRSHPTTPQKSPHRSPHRSSQKSPHNSARNSPYNSSRNSPHSSSRNSPQRHGARTSPQRGPQKSPQRNMVQGSPQRGHQAPPQATGQVIMIQKRQSRTLHPSQTLPSISTSTEEASQRGRPRSTGQNHVRTCATDTDLRYILNSTEQRLRDGHSQSPVKTPQGSPTRDSPTKTPGTCMTASSNGTVHVHHRSSPHRSASQHLTSPHRPTNQRSTPSPTRRGYRRAPAGPTTPSGQGPTRNASVSSVSSAANSLIAEATQELVLPSPRSSPVRSRGQEWEVLGNQAARQDVRGLQASPQGMPLMGPNMASLQYMRQTPQVSPQRSPQHSPQRSLQHSTQHTPQRSPQHSPQRSPQHSPQRSPQRSPERSPQRNYQPSPQGSPEHKPQPDSQRNSQQSYYRISQQSHPRNPQPNFQQNAQPNPQRSPQRSAQPSPQQSPQQNPQRSPQRSQGKGSEKSQRRRNSWDSDVSSSLSTLYSVGDPEERPVVHHQLNDDPFYDGTPLRRAPSWAPLKLQPAGPRPLRRNQTLSSPPMLSQFDGRAIPEPLRPFSAQPNLHQKKPSLTQDLTALSLRLNPIPGRQSEDVCPKSPTIPDSSRRSVSGTPSLTSMVTESVSDEDSDHTEIANGETPTIGPHMGHDRSRSPTASPLALSPGRKSDDAPESPFNEDEILSILLGRSSPQRELPSPPSASTARAAMPMPLAPQPKARLPTPTREVSGSSSVYDNESLASTVVTGSPSRSSTVRSTRSARSTRNAHARLSVGNTIAELRRMNSMVSAYSTTSAVSTAVCDIDSPMLAKALSGGLIKSRSVHRPTNSSRHYLNLGRSTISKAQTKISTSPGGRRTRPGTPLRPTIVDDGKENLGLGFRPPRAGGPLLSSGLREIMRSENASRGSLTSSTSVATVVYAMESQAKRGSMEERMLAAAAATEEKRRSWRRNSVESFYDRDGFLMSSPEREANKRMMRM